MGHSKTSQKQTKTANEDCAIVTSRRPARTENRALRYTLKRQKRKRLDGMDCLSMKPTLLPTELRRLGNLHLPISGCPLPVSIWRPQAIPGTDPIDGRPSIISLSLLDRGSWARKLSGEERLCCFSLTLVLGID